MRYKYCINRTGTPYDAFLTAYFARIGWSDSASVDIETLKALHLLHNGAIPFENPDVLLPREMQL